MSVRVGWDYYEELAWATSNAWQLLVDTDISWDYRFDPFEGFRTEINPVRSQIKHIIQICSFPDHVFAPQQSLPTITLLLTLASRCFSSALSLSCRLLSSRIFIPWVLSTAWVLCSSSNFLRDLFTWVSSLSKWAKTPEESKKGNFTRAKGF